MTKARSTALLTDAPHAVYYALASNIAVAISKYLAAFFTHSGSALAEAIHSSADCLNQLVLLFGDRAARARPDEEHPLGFGRENYVYGMLVAMQLFVIGGLVSVAVGIVRIIHVTPIEHPGLAIAVLCTAGVVEGLALRASIRTIKPSHRARGLLACVERQLLWPVKRQLSWPVGWGNCRWSGCHSCRSLRFGFG